MKPLKIGSDDNLNLGKDFSEKTGLEVINFHELNEIIDAFNAKQLDAMFIPVGTLPYLSNYNILFQSLFSEKKQNHLQTNFITTRNITIGNIPNLTLGRVNKYCTTSYWSPMIYLMDYLPRDTKLQFENADSFQDMLKKTAERKFGAAMVWDIIMEQDPQSTAKVHEMFFLKNLPSPILVTHTDLPVETNNKILQFNTEDKNAFYTGFQTPDFSNINKFLENIKKAIAFYGVEI